jgi:hypothetical protein
MQSRKASPISLDALSRSGLKTFDLSAFARYIEENRLSPALFFSFVKSCIKPVWTTFSESAASHAFANRHFWHEERAERK